MSGDFLNDMAKGSRARVAAAQARVPYAALLDRAEVSPLPPRLVTSAEGFDLIAELKLRSPAVGTLGASTDDLTARVGSYARAGAAAVSVLTEPDRFDGSMDHLEAAARAISSLRVPVMRKDFLVDPYQAAEARLAGAGGVLVILRMLPPDQVEALVAEALRLGLFALLEAFDEDDLELAHALVERHVPHLRAAGPEGDGTIYPSLLVGVNCRDLVSLQVVPGRLEALAPLLPKSVPAVAESGVESGEDAGRLAAAGYDLALVGSSLMKARDPGALVGEMLAAGRAARTSRPGR